jgi:glycerophosphoryl diester phosphodiesterase
MASISTPAAAAQLTARQLMASDRVLVIAHRGDSRATPENTLPAFSSALKVGADAVELDYHHTADNVPVVFHDEDLDRTTNAREIWGEKVLLADKTLGQLRELDSGTWFDRRFAGTRIPTLGEALNVINAGAVAILERKNGDAATTVELLAQKQLLDRVVVQSFDWVFLRECHRLAPSLAIVALGEDPLTESRLNEIGATGAIGIGWGNDSTDEAVISAAKSRGFKVWVWTADQPERIRQLANWGVSGIITNVPRMALEILRTQSA